MNKSKIPCRKTSGLIAKNLIILLVLAVVAFIAIWAWFSKNTNATASGISVKAKSDSVEVSWDGQNYFKDLTAKSDDEVESNITGLAKNLTDQDTNEPLKLSLITGNGIQFFEPRVNRKTGEPLLDEDRHWRGTVITKNNSEGKYIDVDLYFRSQKQMSVYLLNDSAVSPKSLTDRMSSYGNFSKDYICAASRLAFLDSNKENCSFIWAPNNNYQLSITDLNYNLLYSPYEIDSYLDSGYDSFALVSPKYSLAATNNLDKNTSPINLDLNDISSISAVNISPEKQFYIEKNEDGDTYKIININGDAITVTNNQIGFGSTGTDFTLEENSLFMDESGGLVVSYNNQYLVIKNGSLQLASETDFDVNDLVVVYAGCRYKLNTNSGNIETHYYYNQNTKSLNALRSTSTPKLFSSSSNPTSLPQIIDTNTPITTLTKANSSDVYYTSHVVIRIWVEGTDRDALLPLADGLFNVSLHFTSK